MMKRTATAIVLLAGATTTAALADGDKLVVLDWAGYEDPSFIPAYIDQYGSGPSYSFFSDEEEAFQKLRAGFEADAAHPCAVSVAKWREAGVIEPLDISRLDNWDDLNPVVRDAFKFDDGYYLMPADWGTTALTYRTDEVDEAKTDSLEIFLDPEFAGRISLPDNVDDVYALGFLATGVSDWSSATEEQFRAASDWLRKAHQNVRTYWADGGELGQLLTSGEVVAAWAWNETPTTLQSEGIPVKSNRSTKEGSSIWSCGYANAVNGKQSDDLLYDFLNAWSSAESASYIVTAWGYGHGNQTAMDALGTETLDSVGLGSVDVPLLFQGPVDPDIRAMMIAEFEQIKAGF